MGAEASALIKEILPSPSDADVDAFSMQIESKMSEMTKQRDAWKTQIAHKYLTKHDDLKVFDFVSSEKDEQYVMSMTKPEEIPDGIKGAVKSFVEGKYMDGFTNLLTNFLKVILGAQSGSSHRKQGQFIMTDANNTFIYVCDYYVSHQQFVLQKGTDKKQLEVLSCCRQVRSVSVVQTPLELVVSLLAVSHRNLEAEAEEEQRKSNLQQETLLEDGRDLSEAQNAFLNAPQLSPISHEELLEQIKKMKEIYAALSAKNGSHMVDSLWGQPKITIPRQPDSHMVAASKIAFGNVFGAGLYVLGKTVIGDPTFKIKNDTSFGWYCYTYGDVDTIMATPYDSKWLNPGKETTLNVPAGGGCARSAHCCGVLASGGKWAYIYGDHNDCTHSLRSIHASDRVISLTSDEKADVAQKDGLYVASVGFMWPPADHGLVGNMASWQARDFLGGMTEEQLQALVADKNHLRIIGMYLSMMVVDETLPVYLQLCEGSTEPFQAFSHQEMIDIVWQYTSCPGWFCTQVNITLATDYKPSMVKHGPYIRRLKYAIVKLGSTFHGTIYRGLYTSHVEREKMNGHFYIPSFTSGSNIKQQAFPGNTVLEIDVVDASWALEITHEMSKYHASENEILLSCYTLYEFVSSSEENGMHWIKLKAC